MRTGCGHAQQRQQQQQHAAALAVDNSHCEPRDDNTHTQTCSASLNMFAERTRSISNCRSTNFACALVRLRSFRSMMLAGARLACDVRRRRCRCRCRECNLMCRHRSYGSTINAMLRNKTHRIAGTQLAVSARARKLMCLVTSNAGHSVVSANQPRGLVHLLTLRVLQLANESGTRGIERESREQREHRNGSLFSHLTCGVVRSATRLLLV